MKLRMSTSSEKKRGISLIISNKNSSCQKQSSNRAVSPNSYYKIYAKQTHHQIADPIVNKRQIRFSYKNPASVVVYRLQKSQWQKLQQSNKLKQIHLNKIKNEINQLNFQILQKVKIQHPNPATIAQNPQILRKSLNKNNRITSKRTQRTHKQLLGSPFSFSKQQPQLFQAEQQNKCQEKQLQINITEKMSQVVVEQKIKMKSSKRYENQQKQNKNTGSNLQTEKAKSGYRFSRANLIDIKTLEQIENRLSKLIDQTNL